MRAVLVAIVSLGAALLAEPAAAQDHQHIDIPEVYRGRWALDAALCKQAGSGPALVEIGARNISFYEEYGYLSLAQINEAADPPEFFGEFSFVHSLSFHDEVVRLDLISGNLLITRDADRSDDRPSNARWFRCSAE